jgi:hypothetical protein
MHQIRYSNLFSSVLILFGLILFGLMSGAHAENVWVQVRETVIRTKPVFFSAAVAPVKYGDAVSRESEDAGWVKVSFRGKEGFLPSTTVTPSKIILSGRSSGKVMADASDVVLAGKGFSKEVEENYKKTGGGMRYDLVDRIEKQCRVNPTEVKAFMVQGGLNG